MYTYTHLAVGMVVGELFFPKNFYAQLWIIMGAGIPDIATVGKLILDTIKKKEVLKDVGRFYWLITNSSHSFLIGLLFFIINTPLFIGIYSHLIIDLLSHQKLKEFENPRWLWPIPWKFSLGLFDFRKDWKEGKVKLSPSFPEAIILVICLFILLF